MRKKVDDWRLLAASERWLLVRLAIVLPAIGGAIRLFGLGRTYRLLARVSTVATGRMRGGADADADAQAQRLARLVKIASRHGVYRATCLRQSLALWWLLRRRGIPAELRVGIAKPAEELLSHAWVELHGRVVNDHPLIATKFAAYRNLNDRLPDSFRAS